jgi:hypothetical protein
MNCHLISVKLKTCYISDDRCKSSSRGVHRDLTLKSIQVLDKLMVSMSLCIASYIDDHNSLS